MDPVRAVSNPGASPRYIHKAWRTLLHREHTRLDLASSRTTQPQRYPSPEHIFYSVARAKSNTAANRYADILSYDRTSVVVDGQAYLNANVVADAHGRWWVAAQAPVPGAFFTFFRAIYTRAASHHPLVPHPEHRAPLPSSKTAILVQLTGWIEGRSHKADRYLPDPGRKETFSSRDGDKMILCSRETTRRPDLGGTYTKLELKSMAAAAPPTTGAAATKLRDDLVPLTLHHYYFEAWPDHGVPSGSAVDALRELVLQVERQRSELGGQDACEVWVHCSAGVGRTGTFIALSSLLGGTAPGTQTTATIRSPLGDLPVELHDDLVAHTVDGLREYRVWQCQTEEQYTLLYRFV